MIVVNLNFFRKELANYFPKKIEHPLLVFGEKFVFYSALIFMGSDQRRSQNAPVLGGYLNLLISFKFNF